MPSKKYFCQLLYNGQNIKSSGGKRLTENILGYGKLLPSRLLPTPALFFKSFLASVTGQIFAIMTDLVFFNSTVCQFTIMTYGEIQQCEAVPL